MTAPWVERYSRVTTIMVNAVVRGMLRRTAKVVACLGIDEKSSGRGTPCASILTDIDRWRLLDLGQQGRHGDMPVA